MFFEKVCMFFKKYICFLKKYVCFLKKYIFFEKAYIFFVRLLLVHRTLSTYGMLTEGFKSNLEPLPNEQKYVQYYDYCNSNIETFLETIDQELNSCTIDSFWTFLTNFLQHWKELATCKLDVPECSKRTMQNNPWITGGIIASWTLLSVGLVLKGKM